MFWGTMDGIICAHIGDDAIGVAQLLIYNKLLIYNTDVFNCK
jgi:hypothetical protein